jgi:hypothetical protein
MDGHKFESLEVIVDNEQGLIVERTIALRPYPALKTTDSNVRGGASGHTYTFTRQPNGTTDIDVVVVREGKNLKGWMLGLVLGTIGRRVLEKAFENSVKAIEARKGAARAAGAS